jgi:Nitrogen permease regulator 2
MANELFKKISFYLIPNKDLCGQLASLRLDPVLVYMGLPVEILNEKKYERKSYEFNFGIIVTYEQY